MKFGNEYKEPNNPEEEQSKIENLITGKELKGQLMAGIGTSDISIYEDYLKKKEIKYKIYTYKESPELSLLVLYTPGAQRQIFDELVNGNEKIKGGFWSNSTVKEETELKFIQGDNEMEFNGDSEAKEEFAEGDIVELTTEKIKQIEEKDLMIGFPNTTGEISTVSGDMASVDFGGSVRLINLRDIKKVY